MGRNSFAATGAAIALLVSWVGHVADARAAVTAVARSADEGESVGLSGERVLWTASSRRVLVARSAPLNGGSSTEILRRSVKGRLGIGSERLSAAPGAAAVIVVSLRGRRRFAVELFTGAAAGPLARIANPPVLPQELSVDGSAVGVGGFTRADRAVFVVYEFGRAPMQIALPPESDFPVLAGDLIGYGVQDNSGPRVRSTIVVRNWRTGALRYTVPISDFETDFDLEPDGRLVVTNSQGGLTLVGPAGVRRRLPRPRIPLSDPQFAGSAIAANQGTGDPPEHVVLVSPATGSVRRLGPSTYFIAALATGDGTVAWKANGCVLAARVVDPAATVVPEGPCARAEAAIHHEPGQKFRTRTLRVPVRCISSATGRCRGRLLVRDEPGSTLIGRGRYSIAVGRSKRVRARLTRRAARRLRRVVRTLGRDNETGVHVEAITVDQAGRTSRFEEPFYLSKP